MMKSIQFRRNIVVIFSTVLLLVLIYIFYSQVYTRNRENQLIQTRFRVLDQMGDNFKSKIISYESNAKTYEETLLYDFKSKSLNDISKDTISKKITEYKKVFNQDLHFIKFNRESTLPLALHKDSVIISSGGLQFYFPKENLIKNIDRTDVFEKSFIIGDSSIIYCSFSGDLKLVFIDTKKGKDKDESIKFKDAGKSDTLLLPVNGKLNAATIHSNRCYDIALSDGPYKLFIKPIKIEQYDWFIGGLVKKEDFQREKQSIAPWIIIVLSLALLLIILSLPFVKLKVMSRTEMLGTGTVVYAGLAFVLGASFLIHFLFFQAFNLSRIKASDAKLSGLSNQIRGSLSEEMNKIYKQLSDADGKFRNYTESDSIKETDVLNDTKGWKPEHYPYFDYIFWLDKGGTQIAMITPFSIKEKFTNYSQRDYFNFKDEWYWPYDETDKFRKFRMESIVSLTSGDYKAAFSRPSDAVKNPVIVMTGRFYSLIDPIIPKGYKFCIIDKSGKVWFHSNKYQNQGENFIQECNDDKLLKAALYADVTKSMNVSYYNNPHRIHIEPLKDIPLYLVTMYDLRTEYSYQAQVFVTTLLLITGLFFYLIFQVLILLLLKRIFRSYNVHGSFQFDFINFRNSKIPDYKRLILYFIIALLLFCFFIIRMPDLIAIISIFILITILYTGMFIHLHDFKTGSPAVYVAIIMNALIVITLAIFLLWKANDITDKLLWPVIFLFIVLMAFARVNFIKLIDRLKLKPDVAYSLTILLMVILFGVAPILKFFDIAANLEDNIDIRYGQLELARSKEARNINFSKYYTRIENIGNTGKNEARDKAQRTRKELGIYTDFWYHTRLNDTIDEGLPANAHMSETLESLVNSFRPVYNDDFSVVSKYLLTDTIQNRSFKWQGNGDTSLTLFYKSPTEDIHRQELTPRIIRTELPSANIFNPFVKNQKMKVLKEILLYLMFFAILILFFKLILYTTRKVFGVSLIRDFEDHDFKSEVSRHLDDGNSVLLINPSAFIGFQHLAKKLNADFAKNDFKWKEPASSDLLKTWLVKDLAKEYQDAAKFEEKLIILMNWMHNAGKVVILMDINPDVIFSFYLTKAELSKRVDTKDDKKPDERVELYRKTYHLFRIFLKRMPVINVPLKYAGTDKRSGEGDKLIFKHKKIDETLKESISVELAASDYLVGLQKPMHDYLAGLDKEPLSPDEKKYLILNRISEMAEKYYQSLVEACTPDEKFVLLDLASDSIANIKNKNVVIDLLRRGLLVNGEDSVILMNDSFRLFLVSHYSLDEKHEFKKAMGVGPSNWTGYKIAILLIIFALFAFIFISNQDFLNNLNKLFITLGASIAGITSLLGLLGKKSRES